MVDQKGFIFNLDMKKKILIFYTKDMKKGKVNIMAEKLLKN